MTDFQVKVRWIIAIAISFALLIVLIVVCPSLPGFNDLMATVGTVDSSTVDTRPEGGSAMTVFTITLEGKSNTVYVVMKGQDPGYYRATQTIASGDDIVLWSYPIKASQDLRVWQLSDRGDLIVNYNDVYGIEKRYRNEIVGGVALLICLVNGLTFLKIHQATTEIPAPPSLEIGE